MADRRGGDAARTSSQPVDRVATADTDRLAARPRALVRVRARWTGAARPTGVHRCVDDSSWRARRCSDTRGAADALSEQSMESGLQGDQAGVWFTRFCFGLQSGCSPQQPRFFRRVVTDRKRKIKILTRCLQPPND